MPKNYEKMWRDLSSFVNKLYMIGEQNTSEDARSLLGKVQNKIKELENPELFKRLYQKPETTSSQKPWKVMEQKDLSLYRTIYLFKLGNEYGIQIVDLGRILTELFFKQYTLAKRYYDGVVKEYIK